MGLDDIRATLSRTEAKLKDARARLTEQPAGRHRAEPEHRLGLVLFFTGTVGVLFAMIITAFIVWNNPQQPLAPMQYRPSSPAVLPKPVVFPPWKQETSPPRTYTVKAGDTMWSIARKECGNGLAWRKLQAVNSNNPWWLGQGQVLKISC